MGIKIIAAIGDNNEIGYLNDLPWENIAKDMELFMINTMEDKLIMGRATWDSLGRQPLPGRIMIIISRQPVRVPKGHYWYSTPEEAMKKHPNAWVIGGASLYANALTVADEMLLSHINGNFIADRYFPSYDKSEWAKVEETKYKQFTQCRYIK